MQLSQKNKKTSYFTRFSLVLSAVGDSNDRNNNDDDDDDDCACLQEIFPCCFSLVFGGFRGPQMG